MTPLGFLVGTWEGEGEGHYPTIQPFGYRERVTFTAPPKPLLAYAQQTSHLDDGRALHGESGFWRWFPDGEPSTIELVLAHGFGATEVGVGRVDGTTLHVVSTRLASTPSAKEVTEVTRAITVDGDVLTYDLSMAAVGQPLTHHLHAELRKVVPPT
jgi:hypothetical protein